MVTLFVPLDTVIVPGEPLAFAITAELISAALDDSTAVGFASLEMFISFVISLLRCWLCYRA